VSVLLLVTRLSGSGFHFDLPQAGCYRSWSPINLGLHLSDLKVDVSPLDLWHLQSAFRSLPFITFTWVLLILVRYCE